MSEWPSQSCSRLVSWPASANARKYGAIDVFEGLSAPMRWKKFLRWQFVEVSEAAKPISAMYSRFVLATHSA
jgi:hypothetical protein